MKTAARFHRCEIGVANRKLRVRGHLAQARLGDYIVSTLDLSKVLFRDLLLPFEITSVLILIAILGAVALASKEH